MRQIELCTEGGNYVATVEIPPCPDGSLPKVVVWGNRFFRKNETHYVDPKQLTKPWFYFECFAFVSLTPSPGLPRWEPTPPPPVDRSQRAISGQGHEIAEADTTLNENGQQRQYAVLSDAERAKGFVRPVRTAYRHLTCGVVTTMSRDLAETYARDPGFYSGTFCVNCSGHYPVGASGQFVWEHTDEKVGT